MNKIMGISLLLFLGAISFSAQAADIDGSTPIFCAFTKAMQCHHQQGCDQVSPEDVNLPTFVKVDFKNKLVSAISETPEGKTRTTEIKSFQRVDGQLVLQGHEARAWSVIIGEKTGKVTLALASEEDGFLLFGTCIVP